MLGNEQLERGLPLPRGGVSGWTFSLATRGQSFNVYLHTLHNSLGILERDVRMINLLSSKYITSEWLILVETLKYVYTSRLVRCLQRLYDNANL